MVGDSAEWRNSGHTSIHISSDAIPQTLEIFRILPITGGSSVGKVDVYKDDQ